MTGPAHTVSALRSAVAAALSAGVLAFPLAAAAQQAQPQQRPAQGQPAQQRPAAQPAQQQAQPPAGPTVVALKGDPNQTDWTKVCGKDPGTQQDVCYTTRDFVAENDTPVLALAVYETRAGQQVQRTVRFLLPLTFLLQPGIRSNVDSGQPVNGRYTICVQNGCFAEFTANEAFLNSMKRGQTMTVQVQNQAGREVSFTLPLAGFGKGFDGPAIDPRVLEEQQRKLQEELQRRSEEMRRQLQGGAQPGAAAPAPAAGQPAPRQ
jgi:invasion protein IalB